MIDKPILWAKCPQSNLWAKMPTTFYIKLKYNVVKLNLHARNSTFKKYGKNYNGGTTAYLIERKNK